MDYKTTSEKNCRTVISVSVPAEEVQPKLDNRYNDYQKNVKLEGFRKGKVPRQLVKKMFGKNVESEVYEPYFNEAWKKVFENDEYDVINTPRIENVNFDSKDGLTFDIAFDVRPVIEEPKYENISVEKVTFEVTEKDVEDNLKALQEQNAMIYTVDGEAKVGHILLADLQELDRTGVPIVGNKYPDQQIWLTEDNKNLSDQLVGIKVGEERKITLEPEGHHADSAEASSSDSEDPKEHYFQVSVKDIKERKVPELDDDLAKDIGNFDTIKDLQESLKNNMEARAASEAQSLYLNSLIDEFLKINDFQVPQSMVDNYINSMIKDAKNDPNRKNVDEGKLREYYKFSAIRTIKWYLLREKLVEVEKLKVAAKDVTARIKEIEQTETGKERAKQIKKDAAQKENLKDQMLEDKVMDFLASKVEVKEVTKPWRVREAEEA